MTQANQEGFKSLESRCQELMETVLRPLKGKELSEIPPALKDSLDSLERYASGFCIVYLLMPSLVIFSHLAELSGDVEQKLKLGVLKRAFNHEEHTTIINDMNIQITQFLDLYTVSPF